MTSTTYRPQTKYKTRLSRSCTASDSTLYVDTLPADSSGILMIDKDSDVNYEIILYAGTAGAGTSGDPYRLTGCVRGLASSGVSLSAGTGKIHGLVEIGSVDVHYFSALLKAHVDNLQFMPQVATAASLPTSSNTKYDIRFVQDETAFYYWTLVSSSGTVSDWDPLPLGSIANATETTAGKVELATPTDMGAQSQTGDSGGPLAVQPRYIVRAYNIYIPAFLTGGSSATSLVATWAGVTNGEFAITINGTLRNVTGINFTGVTTMAQVATTIQTAIRALTGSTETVVWSTDHFVITSADTTSTSAMTVTSAVSGGSGTDISGVGATAYMDSETGRGTVTNKVISPTAHAKYLVGLDDNGKFSSDFDPGVLKSLTAGENFSQGDLAYVESDGQAYKTVRNASAFVQAGSLASTASSISVLRLSDSQAVAIYVNSANDIEAVVLDISRTTATPGTAATAAETARKNLRACLIGSAKFAAVYQHVTDNEKPYAIIGTISGSTVTLGTPVKLYNAENLNADTISVCSLGTDKFLCAFVNETSDDPIAVASSVSGTVPTPGTAFQVEAVTSTGATLLGQLATDVACIFYDDGTNVSYKILEVSGTTVTGNTPVDLYAGVVASADAYKSGAVVLDSQNVLLYNLIGSTLRISRVVNPDDSAWSTTPAYLADGDIYLQIGLTTNAILFPMGRSLLGLAYQAAGGSPRFRQYELVYGGLREIFSSGNISGVTTLQALSGAAICVNSNKALLVCRDSGDSQKLKYSVFLDTSEEFVGAAGAAITSGNSGSFIAGGDVTTSGLTAGSAYFIGDAGAYETSGRKRIGIATSTTNIYLN